MEDGKLYVIITDQRPQEGKGTIGIDSTSKKSESSKFENYLSDQFFSLIKNTAVNAVNFTVNNIGNFTGMYESQKEIQYAVDIANKIIGVGKSAVVGFAAAGPIGAIAGVTLNLLNQGIQFAESYLVTRSQEYRSNYRIQMLQERSGLWALGDGSRGTLN